MEFNRNPSLPAESAHEISSPTKGAWTLLWAGVLIGFILILYHSTHTPTYTVDSYFYLSKAQQLIHGKGLTTSWNDGIDPKYFPGYSLILAPSLALGGSFIPVQLLAYLLSAFLLIMVLRDLNVGSIQQALAASAFSVNPIVIKWYSLPMAEGAALALSSAGFYFFLQFVRKKSYLFLLLSAILGGLAAITRIEALFLLFVFAPFMHRERKSLKIGSVAAGAALFFLPLILYFFSIRTAAGAGPAYIREFGYTIASFNYLKNFLYNIWVPFGLMQHWPLIKYAHTLPLNAVVVLSGNIWILLGGSLFLLGIYWGIRGHLGATGRASTFLFLIYTALHALWYYRYERFMLLALPICALIWAGSISFCSDFIYMRFRKKLIPYVQALLIAGGLTMGYLFTSIHARMLQDDTSRLPFSQIASTLNELNAPEEKPILTDLGPHLAYYLEAHSYMDDDHGNYWQRAFPPEQTIESLNRLGIRLVATSKTMKQWLAEHHVSSENMPHFQQLPVKGVTVIRYQPPNITGS